MSLLPVGVRRLFVANLEQKPPQSTPRGQAVAANAPLPSDGNGVGAFIAPQSVTTFPGAVVVVTLISLLLEQTGLGWVQSGRDLTPLIPSLLVGATVFLATVDERSVRPKSVGKWMQAILAGVANTVMLFMAATGAATYA